MAGQAEKKRLKSAQERGFYYLWIIVGITLVFLPYRVFWQFASFSWWHLVGTVFIYVVYYFTYFSIKEALQLGLHYEYSQDLFIINAVVQVLVMFTDYGWALYLSLPAYIGYKFCKFVLDWVFTPDLNEVSHQDSKLQKKQEKLERRAAQYRR